VVVSNRITLGGSLTVANLGGTYVAGDTFKLFNATTFAGSFSSITLPPVGVWDTTQLGVNGTLRLASTVSTVPTNISYTISGTNLNVAWPSDHLGWRLLAQTNPASIGLTTNWYTYPNSTNLNSVSIPINRVNGSLFLRLVYP
jgi:hypothetical protein